MIKLDVIAQDLFNKIRGRFPSITIGTSEGTVTNDPKEARFFDFDFKEGAKVNVTLDDKNLTVMYNDSLIQNESDMVKKGWFDFMKEMRQFAKKRMLQFDTRNITKNNLDRRDYDYQVKNRPGEQQMSESTMYGTSRNSIQDVGNARVLVKHSRPVNQEQPGARTRDIHSLYVESGEGERFKYPFRHLNGARAMARHVAEGGNQYDDFGKFIVSLSEELSNLRKFKTYMNRSAVMAEGLRDYMGVVNERIDTVKETILKLQKETHYKETFKNFSPTVNEEVPEDVSNSWIDELTIRQFNEELKSVFPYIYKLVSEANKVKELGPNDLTEDEELEYTDGMTADEMFAISQAKIMDNDPSEEAVSGPMFVFQDIKDPAVEKEYDAKIKAFIKDQYNLDDEDMNHMFSEVSSMGMNKYGLAASKIGGKFKSYQHGELTGEFDSMEELQKHQMELVNKADDKKEASGPEGGMEPHAHKFYIDGDYDQDRGISDKDCEQMEMACKKAGIECKCEPDEMRQGGVVIHTMAPRDAVMDVLDKEGYNVEEAIIEPADDFADRINSINPKHDEQEQDATEGNEFAQKVRELKAKGAKPGTKFKTSDGEEHTLEQAITKVGLNVEDFFTAEELANENPMTQADLDSERFGELHDFEEFKDAVMSDIKDPKGAYAGKDKKEIIAMLRKEADSIGYADVSDGDRRPEEPTWLNKIADEMENEKTPDQTEEEDPKTDFTKWLKSNYNKSPRDLKGDEYVKMSKEFQASKKKEDAETEEPEIELEEFVKSLYDYTSNSFPKGETAVLTAVEKKYGETSMRPAAEMMKELVSGQDQEMERIKKLAGV
tara:strand:+ start:91 stop:2586 length:2496 start_codon:yes stop_codon:yes gene_type:complete